LEAADCFGDSGANQARHDYFAGQLRRLSQTYPGAVEGPYGEGMMIAFTPGGGTPEEAKRLMTIMYEEGLLGFLAGSHPTRIRFLPPPAITTRQHIDAAIDLLEQSLRRFTGRDTDPAA